MYKFQRISRLIKCRQIIIFRTYVSIGMHIDLLYYYALYFIRSIFELCFIL